jgi:hypothetical protein
LGVEVEPELVEGVEVHRLGPDRPHLTGLRRGSNLEAERPERH